MGIKVHLPMYNEERVFEHAREWYVTDERVLQIYQEHEGNREFVIVEYNQDAWESVEYYPPVIPPQPSDADRPAVDPDHDDVNRYDENGEEEDR